MKTLLISAVACIGILFTHSVHAGYVYWETFNYYTAGNGVAAESAGKWAPWKGPAESDDAMIGTDPTAAGYGNNLRLSQAEQIGAAGFQEVVSYFPDVFSYAGRARVRMMLFHPGDNSSDHYLWLSSGDPITLETAYTESGPGALIVNWTAAGANGVVPLHFWTDSGLYEIGAMPTGQWNEVQYDLIKNEVGDGGTIGISLNGTFLGATDFPLVAQDSRVSNVVNAFDFYATGDDVLMVDNIVIEDIPVDVNATNFYVAVTGNDANDGTTPDTAWATVGHAMTALEGIGVQLNPDAFIDLTTAQPLPTQNWAVINVSTGVFSGENNIIADTLDMYRFGYSNEMTLIRDERLHNFLVIKGAGMGKTIFVDELCVNEAKFKVYSRWVRLEDFTLWANGQGGGESFFTDPIHFRPIDGMGMDYRVERVEVRPHPGAPAEILGNRAGVSFLSNWNPIRNKVVRGCLFHNVGIGVKNYNNPSIYPVLVENCTFADLTGEPFGGRGIGVLCEGAGGFVKNSLFINITTNAPDDTRGIGVATWPIAEANRKIAFSQLILTDNNMFNIGQSGVNYTRVDANASLVATDDIYQAVTPETVDGLPHRAGAGNIGYMSGLATVYVDPAASGETTMGLTPATAFNDIRDVLARHSGGVDPSQLAHLMLLDGVYHNLSNYIWNTYAMLRVGTPYLDIQGESVVGTILYYTNSGPVHTGVNLSGPGMQLRDVTVMRSDTVTDWAWFSALVESWFAEGVVISNVQILQPEAGASTQPCIHFYAGNNHRIYNTLAYGGTVGIGLNINDVTARVYNSTFVNNNGTGDGSGQTAFTALDPGQYIYAENCIVQDNNSLARPRHVDATIEVQDSVVYNVSQLKPPAEPGTLIETTFVQDPQLAPYQGKQYTSPLLGYGWAYSPPPLAWPRSRRDAHNSCLSIADCSRLYAQEWEAPLTIVGETVTRSGHIAMDNDKIVVLAPDATLNAYDRATGADLWYIHLGRADGQWTVGGDPHILDDGTILVVASNFVWRLDTDGSVLWQTQIRPEGWAAAPVAVSPDASVAYAMGGFGSASNSLIAVDVATGAINWRFYLSGTRFGAMPVDSDGTIYIGSTVGWAGADGGGAKDYSVMAVNSDGTLKWKTTITHEMMQGMLLSSDESKLFFKTFNGQGNVMCLDAATGAELWKVSKGAGDAFPDIARDANDNLYGGGHAGMAKWDSDGNLLWVNTDFTDVYVPAISANGIIWYRAQNTPDLVALDAVTGEHIMSLPVEGVTASQSAWAVPAIDENGYVYVATHSNLYCFAPQPFDEIGWCNLQWPHDITVVLTGGVDVVTEMIYGQVWIDGITSDPGPTPDLDAWVGFGPPQDSPVSPSWTWVPAEFNVNVGNNDEFMTNLTITVGTALGDYAYCYRYQYSPDPIVGETVFGLKDGLYTLDTIDPAQYGELSIIPEPASILVLGLLALLAVRRR